MARWHFRVGGVGRALICAQRRQGAKIAKDEQTVCLALRSWHLGVFPRRNVWGLHCNSSFCLRGWRALQETCFCAAKLQGFAAGAGRIGLRFPGYERRDLAAKRTFVLPPPTPFCRQGGKRGCEDSIPQIVLLPRWLVFGIVEFWNAPANSIPCSKIRLFCHPVYQQRPAIAADRGIAAFQNSSSLRFSVRIAIHHDDTTARRSGSRTGTMIHEKSRTHCSCAFLCLLVALLS